MARFNGRNLVPIDGELYLFRQFFAQSESDLLYEKLETSLAWQEESIVIFGKSCKVPRLTCWYGEVGAVYRYSGVDHSPLPWTDDLLAIKSGIEHHCLCRFNSVLANLYRNGQDSMGCHADNEKELGVNPVIASLSLGETRAFKLHHNKRNKTLTIDLSHGDLLIMAGVLQHHWVHSLPKTKQAKSSRINLTFRKILTPG